MAFIDGDLLKDMRTSHGDGVGQAVLVIDEQGEQIPGAYLAAYQRVLSLAKTLGLPIIFIELHSDPSAAHKESHSSLRQAASGADVFQLWKTTTNAFEDTHLDLILECHDVK